MTQTTQQILEQAPGKINLQVIDKQVSTTSTKLEVESIWPTIQGEGRFRGHPAIFIRMSGCNLQCPRCDTDYTSQRIPYSVEEVVRQVDNLTHYYPNVKMAVVTGGEPFRQNISGMLRAIAIKFRRIQIETNGTLFPRDEVPWDDIHVTCSPKTEKINKDLIEHIDSFKYIIEAGQVDPEDGLPLSVLGNGIRPYRTDMYCDKIFVQPQDDDDPIKNKENTEAAVASCMRFGYILSLQDHKTLNLP